jgi:hypothetical protein
MDMVNADSKLMLEHPSPFIAHAREHVFELPVMLPAEEVVHHGRHNHAGSSKEPNQRQHVEVSPFTHWARVRARVRVRIRIRIRVRIRVRVRVRVRVRQRRLVGWVTWVRIVVDLLAFPPLQSS